MSEEEAPMYPVDDDDVEMQAAFVEARRTFKYFWRELSWEYRRIIPALELSAVKVPFNDGPDAEPEEGVPGVEQMWISDVDFDGQLVSGILINEPSWLKKVKAGDATELPLSEISDWMYVLGGRVYGAYTVNLLRSRMEPAERAGHDRAWGFDFGDPSVIELVPRPTPEKKGVLKKLFGKSEPPPPPPDPNAEHPMSINMGPKLVEFLTEEPEQVNQADDRGFTLLHQQALAGNLDAVNILLEHGADRSAKTPSGMTAEDLAAAMSWDKVLERLKQ